MKNFKNWKLVERFANTEDYKGNTIISLDESDILQDFKTAESLIDYYFNSKNNGFEIMKYNKK